MCKNALEEYCKNDVKITKESINKNSALFGMQNIIYVAYSHSLKEEEALASLEKLNSYRKKNKEIDLANLVDQKQLENDWPAAAVALRPALDLADAQAQ